MFEQLAEDWHLSPLFVKHAQDMITHTAMTTEWRPEPSVLQQHIHSPCFQSIQSRFPAALLVYTPYWINNLRKWSSNKVLTKLYINTAIPEWKASILRFHEKKIDLTIHLEMLQWQNGMLCSKHAKYSAAIIGSQNFIMLTDSSALPSLKRAVRLSGEEQGKHERTLKDSKLAQITEPNLSMIYQCTNDAAEFLSVFCEAFTKQHLCNRSHSKMRSVEGKLINGRVLNCCISHCQRGLEKRRCIKIQPNNHLTALSVPL